MLFLSMGYFKNISLIEKHFLKMYHLKEKKLSSSIRYGDGRWGVIIWGALSEYFHFSLLFFNHNF